MAPLLAREPSSACLTGAARSAFDGNTKGVKTEHRRLGKRETEMSGWATSVRPFGHKLPDCKTTGLSTPTS
jgi:hypothetical protein